MTYIDIDKNAFNQSDDRQLKKSGPKEIDSRHRIFKCECCNDTGMVQAWKINKFCRPVKKKKYDGNIPVYCEHYTTCGHYTIQTYSKDENTPGQEVTASLFMDAKGNNTLIGRQLARNEGVVLSREASLALHNAVINDRIWLAETAIGAEYCMEVRRRAREETSHKKNCGSLIHISQMLGTFDMPEEPERPINTNKPQTDLPF